MDLGVFARECVVVSWGQPHAAGVVSKMDARKPTIAQRGRGWIGESTPALREEGRGHGLGEGWLWQGK